MHRESAAWRVRTRVSVQWCFLSNEMLDLFVKSKVVAGNVRVGYRFSGQVYARAANTRWCKALEGPFTRRSGPNKDVDVVRKVLECAQV